MGLLFGVSIITMIEFAFTFVLSILYDTIKRRPMIKMIFIAANMLSCNLGRLTSNNTGCGISCVTI